jgi:allantoinase
VIDFITTDHSPAPPDIKELKSGNFQKAWGGIAGLQFLLSASWTALENTISIEKFIPLLTGNPARFLGLDDEIGFIKKGYRADLTIWNPDATFEVTTDLIEHRHKATPYAGKVLKGEVNTTIVNGHVVFENGQFGKVNSGRLILKHKD